MAYVVTENCIKCKFMDCVEVCPVDCFYEGENMLVLHPVPLILFYFKDLQINLHAHGRGKIIHRFPNGLKRMYHKPVEKNSQNPERALLERLL